MRFHNVFFVMLEVKTALFTLRQNGYSLKKKKGGAVKTAPHLKNVVHTVLYKLAETAAVPMLGL